MRKKGQIIIAFGACACYGGIPGLSNLYKKDEFLQRKFIEAESITESRIPDQHVPPIEDYIINVKEIYLGKKYSIKAFLNSSSHLFSISAHFMIFHLL